MNKRKQLKRVGNHHATKHLFLSPEDLRKTLPSKLFLDTDVDIAYLLSIFLHQLRTKMKPVTLIS